MKLSEGGGDRVVLYDLSKGSAPDVVAELELSNSVFGPPVNLGIVPNGSLALVADSTVHVAGETGAWTWEPTDRLHVIDLQHQPPVLVETISVDMQPSGLSVRADGTLALVAHRKSQTIGVLKIDGQHVSKVGSVDVGGEQVASVAFTPDGRRAVATKFQPEGKLAFFDVEGTEVTYRGPEADVAVGAWPYNVAVTPDGRLALTADNGNNGASDGQINTVSVVDLAAEPPVRTQQVPVGDGPEGLAISPRGDLAVVALIDGSNAAAGAAFRKPAGSIVALAIADGQVSVVGDPIAVGALPEGVAFSADGRYVYVGNYLSRTISVFRVDGQSLTPEGTIDTPGQPASMRAL